MCAHGLSLGFESEQYQRWADKLVRGWGGPINLEYFAPTRAQDERLRLWWAQMQRLASSPSAVKTILEEMRDTDVRPLAGAHSRPDAGPPSAR